MQILIRASNLRGFDKLMKSLGGDPIALLAKYHLPTEEKRDDNGYLIFRNMIGLLEETAQSLHCPDFGLQLAAYQGMDILGPISVIARSSATVGDAINNIASYLHLHCSALKLQHSIEPNKTPRTIKLEYGIQGRGLDYSVQAYELGLANAVQVIKLLCGGAFSPISTHFMHAPSGKTEIYRQIFGGKVKFNQQWTGFELPLATFSTPLSSVDEQTCKLAKLYLDSQYISLEYSAAKEVSRLIRRLLPTGQCSSNTIASHLSIHKRTLQRRLVEENTSYEQLLLAERQEMVRFYLQDPNFKLSQISGLLGYSEQSAFNRACKDWFGMTPRAYRQQLKA
ncbi:AraC family transcriptional regulator [Shewanella sp. A25]|nr:AraC family transcriptional regulator [Shewanella shenzhenensis]